MRDRPAAAPEPVADDGEDGTDAAPWDDAPEQRETVLDASQHGVRLDLAIVALAPEFSRNHLQALIAQGHVRLDGQVAERASRKVRAGQKLGVELVPTAQSLAFRPEPIALSIVHEDDDLLVIDKPAGLVVHPAAGNWQGTLLNGLLARDAAAAMLPRAGIVHRLDKDTSGLMVVGRTLAAVSALARAIAAREVHRGYLAIAHGAWPEGVSRIDAPLARDPRSRVRMAVVASGRPARTDVERLALASIDGVPFSALRCTLHTGRTHQIRVHLASRGHPLVGDALYGGTAALGMQRQSLHAARLALVHPRSGQQLAFEAPPPADMQRAWQRIADATG
ncbi:MAG: RluA family pseudouridine synthase [Burkholderiaceae bacterium]|nr:RluA family pseudouridine synthase [Burkholderiaceae bacterium]